MRKHNRVPASWVAAAVILLPPALPASETPAGTDPAPATDTDTRWPMRLPSGAERITIYPPRWESFAGDALAGRAAASLAQPGADEPIFGALRLEARTVTDRVARTVRVEDLRVVEARFPGVGGAPEQAATEAIRREIEERPLVLPLDRILADVAAAEREQASRDQLQHAPPRIVFRPHAAVKVEYDGAPLLGEVEGSPLMRAVNTPFFVVLDPSTKTWYLKGAGRWFRAADALGPFQDARDVPGAVTALAEALGPREAPDAADSVGAAAAEIVTATEPTELVWTDGPPTLAPIAGTDLLYVTNTESDLFVRIPTQDHYVLLAGRWYTAPRRDGPWTHVPPDRLPADFARIPPGSAKGDVLAHVTGTDAAREAVRDADVPQAAAIDRAAADRPPVAYDGDPRFAPVENSPVRYAVNTAYSVLEVGGLYYCCYNAVWYVAAAALGPWNVCTAVPPEIYDLPPSCPVYPVRYVYVYDVTPSVVYCGYLPGYLGCYAWDGVVVYGTGYRYPSWCGRVYYPRPCTFGYAAHYRHHHHGWGYRVGCGGPWAWLNIRIGWGGWSTGAYGYSCGGGWWGYGGYRHIDNHHHHDGHAPNARRTEARPGLLPVPNTPAARPPAFTAYAGPSPAGRDAGPGARDGTRGDGRTAVTDAGRGRAPAPPSGSPQERDGRTREPVDARGGHPPVAGTPGHGTTPEPGGFRPPRDPREHPGAGTRDPLAGRIGTPSAASPPRDNGLNRDRHDGTTGWTGVIPGTRTPGAARQPIDGGRPDRSPVVVPRDPVTPPVRVTPPPVPVPSRGAGPVDVVRPRGGAAERPPVVILSPTPTRPPDAGRGNSRPPVVVTPPPVSLPRPPDRGTGSPGTWRGGSPSSGGGSVAPPPTFETRPPATDGGWRSSSSGGSSGSHRGGSGSRR
jgi:hypothetical protein